MPYLLGCFSRLVVGACLVFVACDDPAAAITRDAAPPDATLAVDARPAPAADATATDVLAPDALDTAARWIHLDTHGHAYFPDEPTHSPTVLRAAMVQQGIDAVWVLLFDKSLTDRAHQVLVTGKDDPASTKERILRFGIEISGNNIDADENGHLILPDVAANSWVHLPKLTNGHAIVDWAAAQKPPRLVAMAHGQEWPDDGSYLDPTGTCCLIHDTPVHVARGRLHAIETNSGPPRSVQIVSKGMKRMWTALLSAGFQLPLIGGSDFRALTPRLGNARTIVLIKGPLTFDAVMRGIRAGRTTVANRRDNWLTMRVGKAEVGDTVRVASPGRVALDVETNMPGNADVDVIVNGVVAHTIKKPTGRKTTRVTLDAKKSAWVVAWSTHAVSSPIYLVVDGKPVRGPPADICYMLEYTRRVARETYATSALKKFWDEAARTLAKRFIDAGGRSCPTTGPVP